MKTENEKQKTVGMTEGAARLIANLRTTEGMEHAKAYVCDAFDATVRLIEDAGRFDRDAMTPLLALARYRGLLGELADMGGE